MKSLEADDRDVVSELLAKALAGAAQSVDRRCEIATRLIDSSRRAGLAIEQDILAAVGFQIVDEYWAVATSEPMTAAGFAKLLSAHRVVQGEKDVARPLGIDLLAGRPTGLSGKAPPTMIEIEDALQIAIDAREPFIIGEIPASEQGRIFRPLNYVMLRPRDAALWLLSLPKRRHLVPGSLRRYVDSAEPGAEIEDALKAADKAGKLTRKMGRIEARRVVMRCLGYTESNVPRGYHEDTIDRIRKRLRLR